MPNHSRIAEGMPHPLGRSALLFAGVMPGAPGRAVRRIALELSRGDPVEGATATPTTPRP